MANQGHAKANQILGCQMWQQVAVDFVAAERLLVLLKTELL